MSEIKKEITEATVETVAEAADVKVVADAKTASPDPVDNPDDALASKIKEYGGNDASVTMIREEFGAETVDELRDVTVEEFVRAGLKPVKVRKLLAELEGTAKKEVSAAIAAAAPMMTSDWNAILPSPSTNESFLKALKAGGVLKVDDSAYEAALRVFLAQRCGLYDVPDKLVSAMEKFADESVEPVGPAFFKLKKAITRREFGDLFAAIEGLDGSFVSKVRRSEFTRRIQSELCPAIREAYLALDAWYKSALATSTNPAFVFQGFSTILNGGASTGIGVSLPPADSIRDAADTLKDAINRVFRGTAAPVGAAMAKEAMEIASVLSDTALPGMVGAPNREQMLRKLGIDITPNYARLEQDLVRFVLGYIKFDEAGSGNEGAYLNALWQVGNRINWNDLIGSVDGGGVTGIGGKQIL